MSGQKVLVIDDHEFMLTYIAQVLGKNGYDVYETTRGPEGLELAQSKNPALIILDLKMPEMDGFEVLKALKANDEVKDVPVLLLSGEASLEDVSICRGLGAANYVMKPVNPDGLVEQVQAMIGVA